KSSVILQVRCHAALVSIAKTHWDNAGSQSGAGRAQAPLGLPWMGWSGCVCEASAPSYSRPPSGTPRRSPMRLFAQSGATIGAILLAMAVLAAIETLIPLHTGERARRAHLGANMALTFITFATNTLLNVSLLMTLVVLSRSGLGLLNAFPQPPLT